LNHLTQRRIGLPQSHDHIRVDERRWLGPGHPAMITEAARRSSRHTNNRPDQQDSVKPEGPE
jgi:hypothetical protein